MRMYSGHEDLIEYKGLLENSRVKTQPTRGILVYNGVTNVKCLQVLLSHIWVITAAVRLKSMLLCAEGSKEDGLAI